jgi:hypothetical protein
MTVNTHAPIAVEVNGTVGMMLPTREVMCCRMCA